MKRIQPITTNKETSTNTVRWQLLLNCLLKVLCEDPKKTRDNAETAARTKAYHRTLAPSADTRRYYKTRCIDEPSPDEEANIPKGYPKAYAMRRYCY